jgi:acyl-CoA synthetase (AMP-forming)/AMP-acid ligase II
MLHTSGTTGDPKGAIISHRAWVWNGLTELTHIGLHCTEGDPGRGGGLAGRLRVEVVVQGPAPSGRLRGPADGP